jgi:hypothetical protein
MVASVNDGHRTVQIPLDEIRAVQVDDLAQVLEHRIARIMGSTSHAVRFVGGGELRYVYNSRGQVIELSSAGVHASVSPERVVIFAHPEGGRSWGCRRPARRALHSPTAMRGPRKPHPGLVPPPGT